jgi:hypothetical protein
MPTSVIKTEPGRCANRRWRAEWHGREKPGLSSMLGPPSQPSTDGGSTADGERTGKAHFDTSDMSWIALREPVEGA